jgi:hypothetical protein
MPTSYAWTEQIDTLDAAGVVTATEIKKHTTTWQDADVAAYNAGRAATELAIAAAIAPTDKADTDYSVAATAARALADYPARLKAQSVQTLADAPALALIAAKAQSDTYTTELQPDADIHAKALATALAPLLQPPVARQVITGPGEYAKLPNGAVLSMGPGGEVYQDGERVRNSDGTASAVSKLVVVGLTVWGVGKSNGLWYKRTPGTWTQSTDLDAATLF